MILNNRRPLIIDIKRHALHDGPGIRTNVFFKGCPLRCVWCHNPETMEPGLEIGFYPADCIGCEECVNACPNGAARIDLEGRIDLVLDGGPCPGGIPSTVVDLTKSQPRILRAGAVPSDELRQIIPGM